MLRIAKETGLLFIIGTSGATNLPQRIVQNTLARQGIVIDINPNENLFSQHLVNFNFEEAIATEKLDGMNIRLTIRSGGVVRVEKRRNPSKVQKLKRIVEPCH